MSKDDKVKITIVGYAYLVRSPIAGTRPVKYAKHMVGKDKRCHTCHSDDCPAVTAVALYLKAGGQRAPDPPPSPPAAVLPRQKNSRGVNKATHRLWPQTCPLCGAPAEREPALNSRRRGPGWVCTAAAETRYLHFFEWRYGESMRWYLTRNRPDKQGSKTIPSPAQKAHEPVSVPLAEAA